MKTKAGTDLPILNLRGKDYLEVKWRLVWFREDHPDWSIETEIFATTPTSATVRATIKNNEGRIMSQSHKTEDKAGFGDFLEKAETGAIGRALALVGYGTQFTADELEEGERIVDSPVERKPQTNPDDDAAKKAQATRNGNAVTVAPTNDPGEYVVSFGKKYKGQKIKSIDKYDLDSFIKWCLADCERKGTAPTPEVVTLAINFERYLKQHNLTPQEART